MNTSVNSIPDRASALSSRSSGLTGRHVLVVGGQSGIGLAVAHAAAEAGARVTVASRHESPSPEFPVLSMDVTDEASIRRALEKAGAIDHLAVTVRPATGGGPFLQLDTANARHVMEVKFWGTWRLIRAAQAVLSREGSVTLTSGIAGDRAYPGSAAMSAANAATEALCRCLAVELAPLRVNAVRPGFVAPKPPAVQHLAERFPVGRLTAPEEVAAAFVHLMENTGVTGSIWTVDGGARLV